jgi:Xaa-Pro aminopeptidase
MASTIPERLTQLREQMQNYGIQAYLIPSTDAHQSEYVPDCWQRRPWISGFTGSAGDVVVTLGGAGLWADSRYYLQAADELEGTGITLFKVGLPNVPTVEEWLATELSSGDTLGVDPRVLSIKSSEKMTTELEEKEISLQYVPDNLVDLVWTARPAVSDAPIRALSEKFAGEPSNAKLDRLRDRMKAEGVETHFLTTMDAIAWLFNLRGADVDYNPVFIAYAAVRENDAVVFLDESKLTEEAARELESLATIRPYDQVESFLSSADESGTSVWIDESGTNRWIANLLGDRARRIPRSPVVDFKAIKNSVELNGIRRSHIIDGVAMVRFLKWIEETVGHEPVTELSAAQRLLEFRQEGEGFVGPSFPTISGYGPHGAIVHYSVSPTSDIEIGTDSLYLVDSGGQYLTGTTDITRTVCFGSPSSEQIEMFTRVLRGHIELTTLAFPEGLNGQHIDMAARRALWDIGCNYLHGTGHGIGHYLNVHEGPISISSKAADVKFAEGHVISNEPGFYKDGAYGIRTENLVAVVLDEDRSSDLQKFLRFETLSRCPIETSLIDRDLLGDAATAWLNAFHNQVRSDLSPLLDPAAAAWLETKTEPV